MALQEPRWQLPPLAVLTDIEETDLVHTRADDDDHEDAQSTDSFQVAARDLIASSLASAPKFDTYLLGGRHPRRGAQTEDARTSQPCSSTAIVDHQAWKESIRAKHKAEFEMRVRDPSDMVRT